MSFFKLLENNKKKDKERAKCVPAVETTGDTTMEQPIASGCWVLFLSKKEGGMEGIFWRTTSTHNNTHAGVLACCFVDVVFEKVVRNGGTEEEIMNKKKSGNSLAWGCGNDGMKRTFSFVENFPPLYFIRDGISSPDECVCVWLNHD